MASQFTHRQDGIFSFSSICDKCFRLVATRERESELRQDEAIHSCKISLPGTKPTPAYWGILCRTCTELVAFHTRPPLDSEPGAEGSMAGTIRCTKDHSHIYFPRDFSLFPSAIVIAGATMQKNLETYKAINPFWESSSSPRSTQPQAVDQDEVPRATLPPTPEREIANRAAKRRWTRWGLNKTSRPQ
jgi:hypothetical protein